MDSFKTLQIIREALETPGKLRKSQENSGKLRNLPEALWKLLKLPESLATPEKLFSEIKLLFDLIYKVKFLPGEEFHLVFYCSFVGRFKLFGDNS